MRQRLKYERLSLKYQKQVSDHVYFRNISNNAGIFDYIVGAAEEQECKEAFLAYYFLLVASNPPDQEMLDARIEEWLSTTFGVDIDFEVDDALAKLHRLGLLKREAESSLSSHWRSRSLCSMGNGINSFSLRTRQTVTRGRQRAPCNPRRTECRPTCAIELMDNV